jgi:hypothetical protein
MPNKANQHGWPKASRFLLAQKYAPLLSTRYLQRYVSLEINQK